MGDYAIRHLETFHLSDVVGELRSDYGLPMHVGTVFAQADSANTPMLIREWAIAADHAGFHHIMAYDQVLGAPIARVDACAPFPAPPYTNESTFHEVFTLFSHLSALTTNLQFVTVPHARSRRHQSTS